MFLKYLESLWVAIAFAEAGEHEIAREYADISECDGADIHQQLEVI